MYMYMYVCMHVCIVCISLSLFIYIYTHNIHVCMLIVCFHRRLLPAPPWKEAATSPADAAAGAPETEGVSSRRESLPQYTRSTPK